MTASTQPPVYLPRSRRRRRPRPCPCGTGCGVIGGLCEPHKERLAPIKALINPGKESRWGATTSARKRGQNRGVPMCCLPDCGEPRVPPATYCVEHEHEFASEGSET